jgi:hypothetical protein
LFGYGASGVIRRSLLRDLWTVSESSSTESVSRESFAAWIKTYAKNITTITR